MSDPIKPTYPAWHLYSGRPYTPAGTDIRETFKRFQQNRIKDWTRTIRIKEAAHE